MRNSHVAVLVLLVLVTWPLGCSSEDRLEQSIEAFCQEIETALRTEATSEAPADRPRAIRQPAYREVALCIRVRDAGDEATEAALQAASEHVDALAVPGSSERKEHLEALAELLSQARTHPLAR